MRPKRYPYTNKKESVEPAPDNPVKGFNEFICKILRDANHKNPVEVETVVRVMKIYADVYS
ncbi:TPA: hypothetical protein ACGOTU_001208 [Streptococcus suis]